MPQFIPPKARLLSLCAGTGGIELGLTLANLSDSIVPVQFVELNPFCQRVLHKNFPGVPVHDDLFTFHTKPGQFEFLSAGFPCQPHSLAGKRKASADRRDLFPEVLRIIQEAQPKGILLENVPGLRHSENGEFFKRVVGQIAECGYVVEWGHTTVAGVGGVHRRKRIWILAYPTSERRDDWANHWQERHIQAEQVGNDSQGQRQRDGWQSGSSEIREVSADSSNERRSSSGSAIATQTRADRTPNSESAAIETTWAQIKPGLCDSHAGLSSGLAGCLITHENLAEWLEKCSDDEKKPLRKDQLVALGNAVVPHQCAEVWRRLLLRVRI